MPYIPHTPKDEQQMLSAIGVSSIDSLFSEIPKALQNEGLNNIPEGMSEMEMHLEATRLANKNNNGICFLGAGAYEHHIPAAVWDIASRGEFLTAYTPYQAEASQGTLQLLYEFQTMICELTGMDVANASMYDGATALAEAILMAARIQKHKKSHRVLVAGTLHPLYRQTLETIVNAQSIEVITLPFDTTQGITPINALEPYNGADVTALVIQQPNFFGCLEQVDALANWAHANKAVGIACVNPISLALLKPPSDWGQHGVDIVCGEGQPLGAPMASGGPYFGFFSTKMTHVRQMPGRIIGKTVDMDGKQGFSLTLQAREQHIRRAKATSNICTNQGLLVTAATIHMSLLGPDGLLEVANRCHYNTHYLVEKLTQVDGVSQAFNTPYFHEVLIQLDQPASYVLRQLSKSSILGGLVTEVYYPELPNTLLVCATEMRTHEDINLFAAALQSVMSKKDELCLLSN